LRILDASPGKKLRCPKCQKIFAVPAEDKPTKAEVVEVVDEVIEAAVDDAPRIVHCPKCDKALRVRGAAGKKLRCPKCQKIFAAPADDPEVIEDVQEVVEDVIDEAVDDEDERDEVRRKSRWHPCPKCDSDRIKKVKFTFWGSFLGPALLAHVRCQDCGCTFNGRSGRSNLIPAILFVSVPVAGIGALLYWAYTMLVQRGQL
jgi:ribosomal protein L37AE/L43A